MIGWFSISCCDFVTSLILITRKILVEYKLRTCLPKAFPVFLLFSFSLRCLYSVYVLLIISSLALSTFSCLHLFPNKYALPLAFHFYPKPYGFERAFFTHRRFLLCTSSPHFWYILWLRWGQEHHIQHPPLCLPSQSCPFPTLISIHQS